MGDTTYFHKQAQLGTAYHALALILMQVSCSIAFGIWGIVRYYPPLRRVDIWHPFHPKVIQKYLHNGSQPGVHVPQG